MRYARCHPEREHEAKGMCKSCYVQWRRHQPDFPRAKCHPERYHVARGLCASCYAMFRIRTKPEVAARVKETQREWELQRKYGIGISEYEGLLTRQNGKCAICGTMNPRTPKRGRFVVDHDHRDNTVRGLLCFQCNVGIGAFSENADSLLRAADYLKTDITRP